MIKPSIKALVMDVDGTLTDGKVYMSATGEAIKAFNIKDGYMIARLSQYNITPIIITGRKSEILLKRCQELKIREVYQGIDEKIEVLTGALNRLGISFAETAYIGDDLNDEACMEVCGLSSCPADAVEKIQKKVNYVCQAKGGEGAVREFIDYIVS